ncbi:MAG: hypothetical protein OHK0015_15410 [Chloroflexi bacterium OHK40]
MVELRFPPRILLITAIVAVVVFVLLGLLYTIGGPVNRVDVWLGTLLHELNDRHIDWITLSMNAVSFFGGNGLLFIAAAVVAYLVFRRAWPELFLWIVAVGGVIVFNRVLKEYFEVLRPVVGHEDRFEESTGFPSGHAMIALVTYGLLAALVAPQTAARSARLSVWGGASLLILLIGFSRLYLSVHYLSDVIGGYAAGLAWLAACLWVYLVVARRYSGLRSRHEITGIPDSPVG